MAYIVLPYSFHNQLEYISEFCLSKEQSQQKCCQHHHHLNTGKFIKSFWFIVWLFACMRQDSKLKCRHKWWPHHQFIIIHWFISVFGIFYFYHSLINCGELHFGCGQQSTLCRSMCLQLWCVLRNYVQSFVIKLLWAFCKTLLFWRSLWRCNYAELKLIIWGSFCKQLLCCLRNCIDCLTTCNHLNSWISPIASWETVKHKNWKVIACFH